MNRIILSAIALAIATPALADQPRTAIEVCRHFAADDFGNEARIFVSDYQTTRRAAELLVQESNRADMNGTDLTVEQLLDGPGTIVNERAAMIFKQLADESRG